jgi:hypothetical protein
MKCPGQDSRYWKQNAIFEAKCPDCGEDVEFFKDDTTRRCKKCGHKFLNPQMDFGCASYCKYAEQCIGSLSPELLAQKEDLLKDRVAVEMKRFFKHDFRSIGHATRTARHAEEIAKGEGGNPAVILTAAYLHGLGGSPCGAGSPGNPSAPEASGKAGDILKALGAREELIREVSAIIEGMRREVPAADIESRAVRDACAIASLEEELKKGDAGPSKPESSIEAFLSTETGRSLAKRLLKGR